MLVVDEPTAARRLLLDVLNDDGIDVAGTAYGSQATLHAVASLDPDAVLVALDASSGGGVEIVQALRRVRPRLPVILLSAATEQGAAVTLAAVAAGATDYVVRPAMGDAHDAEHLRTELIPRLREAISPEPLLDPLDEPAPASPVRTTRGAVWNAPFAVLAIGCGTGGTDALGTVLASLPQYLRVPVVVAHSAPRPFARVLATRLDDISKLAVRTAAGNDPLMAGQVLLDPGDRQLTLRRRGLGVFVELQESAGEAGDDVDALFASVAATFGNRALALVLEGTGTDGARGAQAIRSAGGQVFVQDEDSSMSPQMPGAVTGSGQADRVIPLPRIGPDIAAALSRSPAGRRTASHEVAG